jgi:virginiamycin B lyase
MSSAHLRRLRTAVLAGVIFLSICASARGFVYWHGSSTVMAADLDGSNVQPVNGNISAGGAVTSDGSHLYMAGSPSVSGSSVVISRASVDGSSVNDPFVTLPNQTCTSLHLQASVDALAFDGSHLYWADSLLGTIGRANIADGSSPDLQFIRAAGGACGSPGTGPGPEGVAVDASHVYWTNPDQGTIGRANLDGSVPTQSFITGAHEPSAIVVVASNVYWANNGASGGTIGHAQLDGSGALIPASVNESFITGVQKFGPPNNLAAAADVLFFDNGDGWIGRSSLDGTAVTRH